MGVQDTRVKEMQEAETKTEQERAREHEHHEAQEWGQVHEQLDELSASGGKLDRDLRRLMNQARMLSTQLGTLRSHANQNRLQLEEAEHSHGRLEEEREATERRAEIIHWKLQVAETQLTTRPHRSSRSTCSSNGVREIARDSAMTSDSAGPGAGSTGASADP